MKTSKQLNLIRAFGHKEKVFWKRTYGMTKRSWVAFILAIPFITVAHYAFATMSFLFELSLWVRKKPQFKINLQKMVSVPA
jgi:hypothetical protein